MELEGISGESRGGLNCIAIGAKKYFLLAGKSSQISNFGWNDLRNSITIKCFAKISQNSGLKAEIL